MLTKKRFLLGVNKIVNWYRQCLQQEKFTFSSSSSVSSRSPSILFYWKDLYAPNRVLQDWANDYSDSHFQKILKPTQFLAQPTYVLSERSETMTTNMAGVMQRLEDEEFMRALPIFMKRFQSFEREFKILNT